MVHSLNNIYGPVLDSLQQVCVFLDTEEVGDTACSKPQWYVTP